MTPEEYRRAHAGITGRLLAQLLPLLELAPARPSDRQWGALVAAAYPAVYRARSESYGLAGRFYAGERARQTGAAEAVDIPRRNYAPEALDKAWRRTVKPRLDSLDEGDPVPPVVVAEAATVAERHAADAGRQAVTDAARHDPAALGYARTPTGVSTCAFCLMLTSRGPVYKSASVALLRDGSSEPYHDRCDCIAVPVFDDADWPGRGEYVTAKRVWDEHGGTLADFRRYLDGQRPDTAAEQPAAVEQAAAPAAVEQAADDRQPEPPPEPPRPARDVRELSDENLEQALAEAMAGDFDEDAFNRISAEIDRREAERNAATETTEEPPADDWWTPDDEEQTDEARRIDELVSQGWEYRDAYAEVHGVDADELERQERRAAVEGERRPGETLDQTVRRMYDEWVYDQVIRAEADTRGVLLNRAGVSAGIDPISLFSGPRDRARKYASEELKRWWLDHPRMTYTEFRADALGRDSDQRAARRIQEGGGGREFGL